MKLINISSLKLFYGRIFSIRNGIFLYLGASIIDLITLTLISNIFASLSETNIKNTLPIYTLIFMLTIFVRTYLVYIFRKNGFINIMRNKSQTESKIVRKFVQDKIYDNKEEEESIKIFKENLINSSLTVAINVDLPITSLIGELFFTLGAIIFIIYKLGINILLLNLPIFCIILIFTKYLSKRLYQLGIAVLKNTEDRLNAIDNISELSLELSAQKNTNPIINIFSNTNISFNKNLARQTYTQNAMQIVIESSSLIIIFLSLFAIISNLTNSSVSNIASVLAILTRMVPSITRSFASFSQIQYGFPAMKRIAKLNLK